MIILSPSMKQICQAKYLQSGAAKKVLWVMSGTKPTKAQIAALVDATGSISSNALKALGQLKLSVAYPVTALPTRTDAETLKYELANRSEVFEVHSTGPATWFVFMLVAPTINNPTYTTNALIYQSFIGSVGDIGSGDVELEMLGAAVEADKIYKVTDLLVKTI